MFLCSDFNNLRNLCVVGVHKLTIVTPLSTKCLLEKLPINPLSQGLQVILGKEKAPGSERGDAREIKTLSRIGILGFY